MMIRDFLRERALRPNPPAYLSEEWCHELGRSFLRPARPRLAEARALTRDLTRQTWDAPAAWERALNEGLLPASWQGDGARCFVDEPADEGLLKQLRLRTGPAPFTVEAVVALASDVGGILRAEAAGAEWAARAARVIAFNFLGEPAGADGAAWRVLPSRSELHRSFDGVVFANEALTTLAPADARGWLAQAGRDEAAFLDGASYSFPAASQAVADCHLRGRELAAAGTRSPFKALARAARVLRDARLWAEARRRGLVLPPPKAPGSNTPTAWNALKEPTSLADLPDPFEPLLDVVGLGYLPGHTYGRWMVFEAPAPDPARMSLRHHRP